MVKLICDRCGVELTEKFTSFPEYEKRYSCEECEEELKDFNNNSQVEKLKDEIDALERDIEDKDRDIELIKDIVEEAEEGIKEYVLELFDKIDENKGILTSGEKSLFWDKIEKFEKQITNKLYKF